MCLLFQEPVGILVFQVILVCLGEVSALVTYW